MVKKFLVFYRGLLDKEVAHINQAALLLGLFAFLSLVLAFLRDRFLAHVFGAGTELDIYYAAFRIPDFIFVTVASVVSLSVLVPFIIEKEGQSRKSLREFIDSIFSFFCILIVTVSVAAYFLMPTVAGILFKGMKPEALEKLISLSRLMLLSPILLGFSNLFGSLTQAFNRFAIYALAPLLYNLGIILGIVFLGGEMGSYGVAIGVVLGALLHALIQVPFLIKSGLLPRFRLNFGRQAHSMILNVMKISVPRTLTLAMSAITLLFLTSFASLMGDGSISVLTFAVNLQSVPLSLIGVSYSVPRSGGARGPGFRPLRLERYQAYGRRPCSFCRFVAFPMPYASLHAWILLGGGDEEAIHHLSLLDLGSLRLLVRTGEALLCFGNFPIFLGSASQGRGLAEHLGSDASSGLHSRYRAQRASLVACLRTRVPGILEEGGEDFV